MERGTQTGNGGGLQVAAGTLLLDQFEAIVRNARQAIHEYPETASIVLPAVVAELNWCYGVAVFSAVAPTFGMPANAVAQLVNIPIPTAQQRQAAETLQRDRQRQTA